MNLRARKFSMKPHTGSSKLLDDVIATLGPDRHVVVAREVTKLHEEFLRGRASEVLTQLKSRNSIKGRSRSSWARADEARSLQSRA
mgnify:CR=1 FL=1